MTLFIATGNGESTWEGFDYAVNRTLGQLERSVDGWNWETAGSVTYKVAGNKMELAIPLSSLGISKSNQFTIDFKWMDNTCAEGDIQECMDLGDSAPDARFKYRYKYQK